MITDQDINIIYRGYQYASGSQSTGWAEPLPNEVLFFLKANTLKVKPLKLAAGVVTRNWLDFHHLFFGRSSRAFSVL